MGKKIGKSEEREKQVKYKALNMIGGGDSSQCNMRAWGVEISRAKGAVNFKAFKYKGIRSSEKG